MYIGDIQGRAIVDFVMYAEYNGSSFFSNLCLTIKYGHYIKTERKTFLPKILNLMNQFK